MKFKTITYEINFPGEIDAGLFPYSEEITVKIDSGDTGGQPGEFEEYIKDCLKDWYDGATVKYK